MKHLRLLFLFMFASSLFSQALSQNSAKLYFNGHGYDFFDVVTDSIRKAFASERAPMELAIKQLGASRRICCKRLDHARCENRIVPENGCKPLHRSYGLRRS